MRVPAPDPLAAGAGTAFRSRSGPPQPPRPAPSGRARSAPTRGRGIARLARGATRPQGSRLYAALRVRRPGRHQPRSTVPERALSAIHGRTRAGRHRAPRPAFGIDEIRRPLRRHHRRPSPRRRLYAALRGADRDRHQPAPRTPNERHGQPSGAPGPDGTERPDQPSGSTRYAGRCARIVGARRRGEGACTPRYGLAARTGTIPRAPEPERTPRPAHGHTRAVRHSRPWCRADLAARPDR